jgi:hypothetical protein
MLFQALVPEPAIERFDVGAYSGEGAQPFRLNTFAGIRRRDRR